MIRRLKKLSLLSLKQFKLMETPSPQRERLPMKQLHWLLALQTLLAPPVRKKMHPWPPKSSNPHLKLRSRKKQRLKKNNQRRRHLLRMVRRQRMLAIEEEVEEAEEESGEEVNPEKEVN